MNQVYRALHMPPMRLLKKLCGQKEIYTIAIRRLAPQDGQGEPLPALGGEAYTPLPYTEGVWYADPLLFAHGGKRYIFAEAFDMAAQRGEIVAFALAEDGTLSDPQPVLKENYHLSFPTVFEWRGDIWMIPETGTNHSINLYRCKRFPGEWECVQSFDTGRELADTIILDKTQDTLALLCNEVKPQNGLYVRYRRYDLHCDAAGAYTLEEDEPYNLQNRQYDLTSRNAGPLFERAGQVIHPTQVSTTVDYGVYLQFFARRGGENGADCREIPFCAATPDNVKITGLNPADVIGIHTYCRDDAFEIIDVRYLRRVAKTGTVPPATAEPAAEPAEKAAPENETTDTPEAAAATPTESAPAVAATPTPEQDATPSAQETTLKTAQE